MYDWDVCAYTLGYVIIYTCIYIYIYIYTYIYVYIYIRTHIHTYMGMHTRIWYISRNICINIYIYIHIHIYIYTHTHLRIWRCYLKGRYDLKDKDKQTKKCTNINIYGGVMYKVCAIWKPHENSRQTKEEKKLFDFLNVKGMQVYIYIYKYIYIHIYMQVYIYIYKYIYIHIYIYIYMEVLRKRYVQFENLMKNKDKQTNKWK